MPKPVHAISFRTGPSVQPGWKDYSACSSEARSCNRTGRWSRCRNCVIGVSKVMPATHSFADDQGIDKGIGSVEDGPDNPRKRRHRPVLRDRGERRGELVGQRPFDCELIEGLEIHRRLAAPKKAPGLDLESVVHRNDEPERQSANFPN